MTNELMAFDTREQAAEFLTGRSKKEMLQLVKSLDVYYRSGDSRERLADRIIEATVGAKIRSQAIANTRTK